MPQFTRRILTQTGKIHYDGAEFTFVPGPNFPPFIGPRFAVYVSETPYRIGYESRRRLMVYTEPEATNANFIGHADHILPTIK